MDRALADVLEAQRQRLLRPEPAYASTLSSAWSRGSIAARMRSIVSTGTGTRSRGGGTDGFRIRATGLSGISSSVTASVSTDCRITSARRIVGTPTPSCAIDARSD